ncbi:MAG: DUF4876 domain-containing protein [Capnocytophaga sp.]|nr:DUF4876 domain-containing protein [Capnocytophaga sp.]
MRKIVTLLSVTALFWACNKDNSDDNFVQQVTYQMEVTYGKDFNNQPAEGVKITLLNQETGSSYEATTNTEGKASTTLPAGTYNINASKELTAETAEPITGFAQEATFNGSLSNVTITANQASQLITLQAAQIGDLVIKQIYYQGSDVRSGAMFRDQFIEIYNNSNQTIYLDGLCLVRVAGNNTAARSSTQSIYQSNGQLDWSQGEGVQDAANANTKYIFSQEIIAFPGSGEQYPLEAGKSVFVAQTALNHKAPITTTEGKPLEVKNPDLTIDLSKAQFEAYYGDVPGVRALDTDIDTPATNMLVYHKVSGQRDLILDVMGREAWAIVKATKAEIDSYPRVKRPVLSSTATVEAGNVQIPISQIIDGINLQHFRETSAIAHRLPDNIDAGEVKGIGQYTSKAAIRKVKTTIGNRVIYQDTNNSSNDFDPNVDPDLSGLN